MIRVKLKGYKNWNYILMNNPDDGCWIYVDGFECTLFESERYLKEFMQNNKIAEVAMMQEAEKDVEDILYNHLKNNPGIKIHALEFLLKAKGIANN